MIRRLLAVALATSAFVVVPALPAQARACMLGHTCTTTYFTDASQSTVSGVLHEDCEGNRTLTGTRSGWPIFVEDPC